MTKKELSALKKAVKSMKNESDTLNIEGREFLCNWNGKAFEWVAPSKKMYICTAKEVCNFIANGEYIVSYYADIRNDLDNYYTKQ